MLLAHSTLAVAQDTALTIVTRAHVRIRQGPDTTAPILRVLTKGERVALTADTSTGEFWHVQTQSNVEGWVHGRFLALRPLTARAAPMVRAMAAKSKFPACGGEQHFRWEAKKSTAQEPLQPTITTVSTMLGWAPRSELGNDLASWCAPRAGRELKNYRVTGWVRRIKKSESDHDWHVEITSSKTSAVTNCVIVEIPNPQYGQEFQTARDDLDNLVANSAMSTAGDLSPAVRVKFTGAAFTDAWHGPFGAVPTGHGRCNSTTGAVWELHPVFKVAAP
jgi:uncharacterized protein YraI